jgi:Zinc dependent phospholipase C
MLHSHAAIAMRRAIIGLALAMIVVAASPLSAYSVLTHEAAIDVTWDGTLRPLLLRRFPRTSPEALVRARSFAYGGSVIQDLGYYPFGNKFFSNLVHYVRSGDFVEALVREARDVDELAFALGALAHYSNDTKGHPEAVNVTVPMVFPKLHQKYGDAVTYAQAPRQHVIVEFSFDIVHAAGGAYLPDTAKRFIGFRVATPLLERAFRATYGLELRDLFADQDRAIATYRYAVSQVIPALTKAAWRDKHDEIVALTPHIEQSAFVFVYPRADFERDYGRDFHKPGLFARFLGVMYRVLPKVGPLKPLAFKAPNAQAAALFAQSFRDATARFRAEVRDLSDRQFEIRNTNFDTGRPSRYGEYSLADDTYAELLDALAERRFVATPVALTRNIVAFYGDKPQPALQDRKARKQWARVERSLRELRQASDRRAASGVE